MTKPEDHRKRVAATRREKMRARLLETALHIIAKDGLQAFTIDRLITDAGVSRGTFYKYYDAPEALVRELAVDISNELIQLAEPLVQKIPDPAARIATGLRALMKTCAAYPVLGHCMIRLDWSDINKQHLMFNYVKRDLDEALRTGQFKTMHSELALCLVGVSAVAGLQVMMLSSPEPDLPEQTAVAILRALGVEDKKAQLMVDIPIDVPPLPETGLICRATSLNSSQR
jgi:TetR/AcrR family transcriptional regulator, ethionamide resistance regulator